jgi:hypothetical protein
MWYVDASFAVHPSMHRHSGGGLTLGRGFPISVSTKQKLNTRSSTESELVGVDDRSKEVHCFANLCLSLGKLDCVDPSALSVLDPATGEFLKHRQLCRDPRYKTVWDTSYANESGRLCQGIGSGSTPTSQRVAGTNTFFIIDYQNIPLHKCKEICHTMVVCEVRPEKDDPDQTRIMRK